VESEVFAFCCTAALANIQRHQFALTAVELLVFRYFPFVKTALAQGFSLVNFAGTLAANGGTFKGKDVGHVENLCFG